MNPNFGHQLKTWRHHKGVSQLSLAAAADVSQKHISFIESGRSTPSREMVTHLGRVLGIPPREQNRMLVAAGHAPVFAETDFDDLEQVRDSLEFMVEAHAPYMAVVVDRMWNVLLSNQPAATFAAKLIDPVALGLTTPLNLMYATFHPEGLRRHMTNWAEAGPMLFEIFERGASRHPGDEGFQEFVESIRRMLGSELPAGSGGRPLLVPVTYAIDGVEIRLFTTIATIGGASDITVSELLIETFWPADAESDRVWRSVFA